MRDDKMLLREGRKYKKLLQKFKMIGPKTTHASETSMATNGRDGNLP